MKYARAVISIQDPKITAGSLVEIIKAMCRHLKIETKWTLGEVNRKQEKYQDTYDGPPADGQPLVQAVDKCSGICLFHFTCKRPSR